MFDKVEEETVLEGEKAIHMRRGSRDLIHEPLTSSEVLQLWRCGSRSSSLISSC